jgi:hypothetical protein
MYRMIQRVLGALSLCAFILGVSHVAAGETSSRFAASYRLSGVVEHGSQVDVTIKLTLLNPGSSDVNGGIVVLYNSALNRSFLGSFKLIKTLPHLGQVTTTSSFTISAAEYARWQQGHPPVLEFLVPDAAGTSSVSIQAHRVVNPGESIN